MVNLSSRFRCRVSHPTSSLRFSVSALVALLVANAGAQQPVLSQRPSATTPTHELVSRQPSQDREFHPGSHARKSRSFAQLSSTTQYYVMEISQFQGHNPRPLAINDSGQVAGSRLGGSQGLVWTPRGVRLLTSLPTQTTFTPSGLNSLGMAAGGVWFSADETNHAVLWDSLGIPSVLWSLGAASDINSSGHVVGSQLIDGEWKACRWTPAGGFQRLDTVLSPSVRSYANSINWSGAIVGRMDTHQFMRGFYLSPDLSLVDFGNLLPGVSSIADEVNDNGTVVLRVGNGWDIELYLWSQTSGLEEIGHLADSDYAVPRSINNNEVIACQSWPQRLATVWDRESGFRTLNSLLHPRSSDWILADATDINNQNQIIGYGRKVGDAEDIRAFIATPYRDPPQPTAVSTIYVHEGQLVSFTPEVFFEGDPSHLEFSLIGTVPEGASVDRWTGSFSWRPGELHDGVWSFAIRVRDLFIPENFSDLQVLVEVWEEDQPPTVDPIPDQTTFVDESLTFRVRASDPDVVNGRPQPMWFALTGARPQDASIVGETGEFEWMPHEGQVGVHNIEVVVISGTNEAWGSVKITVGERRRPAIPIESFSLAPDILTGGQSSTGRVVLKLPAGPEGYAVSLRSHFETATVPLQVVVPADQREAFFTITTRPIVSGLRRVLIEAKTSSSNRKFKYIYIRQPYLARLAVDPVVVYGGSGATGVVELTGPVATSVVVNLESDHENVGVPTTVTIPFGAASVTFPVATRPSDGPQIRAMLTARLGTEVKIAAVYVNRPFLQSLSLTPSIVYGGTASTGTVTLNAPAPAGGLTITLSDNSDKATTPASVTIPEGDTSAMFEVMTVPTSGSQLAVTVSGAAEGVTKTARLYINQPFVTAVSFSPEVIVGGSSTTGTVTLNAPAPAGGFSVSLASDSGSATVPASVVVPAGETSVTFFLDSTVVVGPQVKALISAAGGGATKRKYVYLNPSG